MRGKYALFKGNGIVEIEERDVPAAPQGEVLLKVICNALCGSDLRPFNNGWPCTPGHEILGRVQQPGHALDGKRCLVYIPMYCGKCARCKEGNTNLCETRPGLMGWQRDGGFAEYVLVPEQCLLPIPDEVPSELAPLLLDTMGTTSHGIYSATGGKTPESALVLGAGPIGLGCILVLKAMGCKRVVVSEPGDMRREFALKIGALLPGDDAERFPLVLECSGKNPARQAALEKVESLGAVIFLGESSAPWEITENPEIRRKDFRICRSFYFRTDELPRAIALLKQCEKEAKLLVAEQGRLEDLQTMYEKFAKGLSFKPLVFFPE